MKPTRVVLSSLCVLVFAGCGGEDVMVPVDGPEADPQVVGGQPAGADQLLATVALFDVNSGPFCSGTLVSPTTVVSAAHCFVNQGENLANVVVVAGVLDALAATWDDAYAVQSIAWHSGYTGQFDPSDPDGMGAVHDIAIINLAAPVTVQPYARVLAEPVFDAHVAAGTPVIVTGYGIHDLATQAAGQLYIAETPFVRRTASEFFAGGSGTADSCNGDSGGPAYVVVGQEVLLAGATSRAGAAASAPCGEGGIYTLVAAYDDWLKETSGGAYGGAVDPAPAAPPPGTGASSSATGGGEPTFGGSGGDSDDDDDDDRDRGGCSTVPGAPAIGWGWLVTALGCGLARKRRRV